MAILLGLSFPVLLKNLHISPLGLVPKKNSGKWRTMFHLSYLKNSTSSINTNIPIEDYSLQYVTIDNAILLPLSLGKGAFMSKTDIQSAFCIIPVNLLDWELLGMQWKGMYFFDMLSDGLEWIIRNKLKIPGVLHIYILDDFSIALAPPHS